MIINFAFWVVIPKNCTGMMKVKVKSTFFCINYGMSSLLEFLIIKYTFKSNCRGSVENEQRQIEQIWKFSDLHFRMWCIINYIGYNIFREGRRDKGLLDFYLFYTKVSQLKVTVHTFINAITYIEHTYWGLLWGLLLPSLKMTIIKKKYEKKLTFFPKAKIYIKVNLMKILIP